MIIIIDVKEGIDYKKFEKVVLILREGGFVVFLIEIVYGFGVNVFLKDVVDKIFWVKGRFQDNLLIVYVFLKDMFEMCVEIIDERVYMFIERFWLGLFIIVLFKKDVILENVIVGFFIVGVRMFVNKIVFEFI